MTAKQVTDIPIWEDCPWRNEIPAEYLIRREYSLAEDAFTVCIEYPQAGSSIWVEWRINATYDYVDPEQIRAAVRNLAGERFEREFPGKWAGMYHKQAEALNGKYQFSTKELAMIKRRDELHPFDRPFMLPGVQDTSLGSRASS